MKVLMVEPLGFSGISYYTNSLCQELNKTAQVTLLTSKTYELFGRDHTFLVKTRLSGMNRSLPKPLRLLQYSTSPFILRSIIRHVQPTIVHWQDTFIPLVDQINLSLIKQYHLPIVYTAHDVQRGMLLGSSQLGERRALERIYRLSDHIIVHSDGAASELRDIFKVPHENITKLRLGLQTSHLEGECLLTTQEVRAKLHLSANLPILLFFGNLKISKGLDLLLEAFSQVIHSGRDALLIVAGPQRQENQTDYQQIARHLGIAKNVKFDLRFVPMSSVADYFVASDLVVLPYRKVYQSAVVQTAYAFARPVLVTPLSELCEVVEDGKSGFIAHSVSVDALFQAMTVALDARESLAKMGETAKKMAEERFSWSQIAENTIRLYEKVLKQQ